MNPAPIYFCEVCGAAQRGDDWFLVAEGQDRDTLQILKWNSRLAERSGMRHVCSAAHVEELVSHWMVDDSLDYGWSRENAAAAAQAADAMDESYRLGELMLDRASFAALGERPDMLSSILEAIDDVLQAPATVRSLLAGDEEEAAAVYDA
ncbi:MAG TPA: hypothetical protein VJ756_07920 [Terriglobales bacterium]|jgi:hypothetical protein|nr:hypothetical protein [Terriglobales bacterium]